MCRSYAVVYQNQRSGKVGMEVFRGKSPGEARENFSNYYWYKSYKVLSMTEIPEMDKGKGDGKSDSKRM